jgi:hypothetical protein
MKDIGVSDVMNMTRDGSCNKANGLERNAESEMNADSTAETSVSEQEKIIFGKEDHIMTGADRKFSYVIKEKKEVEERAMEKNGNAQVKADQLENNSSRNDRINESLGDVSQKEHSLIESDVPDATSANVSNWNSLNEEVLLHCAAAVIFSANIENGAEDMIQGPDTYPLDSTHQVSPIFFNDIRQHEKQYLCRFW